MYIAVDGEMSGTRLGVDSLLSWGACIVTREKLTWNELIERNFIFYSELKPQSLSFEWEAIRIGASQLEALRPKFMEPRYYPGHRAAFDPEMVLIYLQDHTETEYAPTAMRRFTKWVEGHSRTKQVEGITNTVFFDSGWFDYTRAKYGEVRSVFGHRGLDLSSLHKGHTKDPSASFAGVTKVGCALQHRADHDATWLAEHARIVLYENLGW